MLLGYKPRPKLSFDYEDFTLLQPLPVHRCSVD